MSGGGVLGNFARSPARRANALAAGLGNAVVFNTCAVTSEAERLHQVRTERRPGSKYASLPQCAYELRQAESLYRRQNVPFINSANMSIEEIAAVIMQEKALRRSPG